MGTRSLAAALLAATALVMPAATWAADTRTFHNVSRETYECTKDIGEARHNTIYEPRHADYGTATTSSFFWKLVVYYRFDPATGDLYHEILQRSWIIPVDRVWAGIADQISECAARTAQTAG